MAKVQFKHLNSFFLIWQFSIPMLHFSIPLIAKNTYKLLKQTEHDSEMFYGLITISQWKLIKSNTNDYFLSLFLNGKTLFIKLFFSRLLLVPLMRIQKTMFIPVQCYFICIFGKLYFKGQLRIITSSPFGRYESICCGRLAIRKDKYFSL